MQENNNTLIEKLTLSRKPIVFDLDGTLWPGDCTHHVLKENINSHGFFKNALKYYTAKFNMALFKQSLDSPINVKFIKFYPQMENLLNQLKMKNLELYLISGSAQCIIDMVFQEFSYFSSAHGTQNDINLVGANKAIFCNEKFGRNNYHYFGNEFKDSFVWKDCDHAIAVNPNKKILNWLNIKKNNNYSVIYANTRV